MWKTQTQKLCAEGLKCAWNVQTQRTTSSLPSLAGKVMAIRREDNSVWERRAPLGPSHVRQLVKAGAKVIVQPSNRRAYPMQVFLNDPLRNTDEI